MGYLAEAIAVVLASSGIIGAVFASLIRKAMKKASDDAERRRKEYTETEMTRFERDRATSELLIALVRFSRKLCSESELEIAESNYVSASAKSDMTLRKHYIESKARER